MGHTACVWHGPMETFFVRKQLLVGAILLAAIELSVTLVKLVH